MSVKRKLVFGLPLGAVLLILAVMGAAYVAAHDTAKPGGQKFDRVAFTNVNIVDAENNQILPKRTIFIENNRISSIFSTGSTTIEKNVPQIDMAGRYMTSGFWDMHSHFSLGDDHYDGPMMIMHGVFYVRDLWGDCVKRFCWILTAKQRKKWDRRVSQDRLLAPRHLGGIGSFLVHSPAGTYRYTDMPLDPPFLAPTTAEEGRQMARFEHARGVDFLKPYNTMLEVAYKGAMDESRKLGIYLGGHKPGGMTLLQALKYGQRTIEHAMHLPMACSTIEEAFTQAYREWNEAATKAILSGNTRNNELLNPIPKRPSLYGHYDSSIDNYDESRCSEILETWASLDSYYVPTHVTRHVEYNVHTGDYRNDPRSQYIPQGDLDYGWRDEEDSYTKLFNDKPELYGALRRYHERGVELTGHAYKAGVKFLVGTDSGDTLIYPGATFFDEMNFYADAGIPPDGILKAATMNAAEFVGRSDEYGSIEEGKVGDAIFMRANPLVDIANAREIEAVFYNGHFYNQEDRKKVMDVVASKARGLRHDLIFAWYELCALMANDIFNKNSSGDRFHTHSHDHY